MDINQNKQKIPQSTGMECYACAEAKQTISNSTFFCRGDYFTVIGLKTELDKFRDWLDIFGNFKMCGAYHNPRYHDPLVEPQDYGIVKYYTDFLDRDEYRYAVNGTGRYAYIHVYARVLSLVCLYVPLFPSHLTSD